MLNMMPPEVGSSTPEAKVRIVKADGKVFVYINDVLIPFVRSVRVDHEGTMSTVKLEFWADMEYGPKEDCCGGC